MTLAPLVLLALAAAGMLAGFVDAIAGGGGLIALPALLAAGVPPVMALGTNKVQSAIGTGIAAGTYWRRGFVSLRAIAVAIACTYAASFAGAYVVKHIDTSILSVAVPIALVAIAIYFLVSPKLSDDDRHARLNWTVFVPLMGALVGFYDGIFGPGTGSFLTMGFVALFGLGITRAAGNTKILNLASNLGALTLFIPVRRRAVAGRDRNGRGAGGRRLSRRAHRHPVRRQADQAAGGGDLADPRRQAAVHSLIAAFGQVALAGALGLGEMALDDVQRLERRLGLDLRVGQPQRVAAGEVAVLA